MKAWAIETLHYLWYLKILSNCTCLEGYTILREFTNMSTITCTNLKIIIGKYNPLPMSRDSSLSKLDVSLKESSMSHVLFDFSLVKTLTNFPYLIGDQQAQFYSQQGIVHIMLLTEHCLTLGAFLWGDPSSDQWSKICLDHGASKEPASAYLCGDPSSDQWSKICLDHGASKEPANPWPECIHRFLWCTMTQTDLGSLIRTPIIPKERTRRSVPLIYHDPDKSWITDPNSDHPKGTHPLSCVIAR